MKHALSQVSRLLLLTLLSAACASTHYLPGAGKSEPSARRLEVMEIERLLNKQDYVAAISHLERFMEQDPDGQIQHKQSAEMIRRAADREYEQNNFAQAGSIYSRILESSIVGGKRATALPFGREYLKKQIKACSKALTDLGIIKYREQKLNEAIALWEQVLQFEPQNTSITKAISTASKQQSALGHLQ